MKSKVTAIIAMGQDIKQVQFQIYSEVNGEERLEGEMEGKDR